MPKIPTQGLSKDEILATLRNFKSRDMNWQDGKVLGYVYTPEKDVDQVVRAAYQLFLTENALDPSVFPSLLKLETDVVRMVANLLHGDEKVVGHLTSGGTESILLAVKTARDKARAENPHLTRPEIVLPRSAHAAFHKAAHYLDVIPAFVDIDPRTYLPRPEDIRAAVTPSTILLVASAPSYFQGVIDPIAAIGQVALEQGLPFHVDACVGGMYLPFLRLLGYTIPDFDFAVPGVTSISADLHKFGYAAKGCSALLYRDKNIRQYQFFASAETTGYAFINSTVLSSKSGGPMAGAWAALHYFGQDGYQKIVSETQQTAEKLIAGINAIPGLRILGEPAMCLFSFASDEINVFQLADHMARRGWYLQSQFSTPATPRSLHVSLNYGSLPQVERLIQDLRECVGIVRQLPPLDSAAVRAAVAQALQSTDPAAALHELAAGAGLAGSSLPGEMALINELLDALPDPLCSRFLTSYFNDLYA